MPTTKEILESIRAQKVTPEVKESETISPETKTILESIRKQPILEERKPEVLELAEPIPPIEEIKKPSLWEKIKGVFEPAEEPLAVKVIKGISGIEREIEKAEEIAPYMPGAIGDTLKKAFPGFSDENMMNIVEENPAWTALPITQKAKLFGGELGKNLLNLAQSFTKDAFQFIATPAIGAVEEITKTMISEVRLPNILKGLGDWIERKLPWEKLPENLKIPALTLGYLPEEMGRTVVEDWIGPLTGTATQVEQKKAIPGSTEGEAKALAVTQQMSGSLP